MKQPQPIWKSPVYVVAALSVAIIAITAGITYWTLQSRQTQISPVSPSTSAVEQTVNLYWLKPDDTGEMEWVATAVVLPVEDNPGAILTAAFNRLLTEPSSNDLYSEIPRQTQLLSLKVEEKAVYLDLSPEFTAAGGSSSMIGRLGQVIYTATTLDPDASVWLSVGGQPLEILGGEGLEIAQPMTRQFFEAEFTGY